jgi:hypothetical protein
VSKRPPALTEEGLTLLLLLLGILLSHWLHRSLNPAAAQERAAAVDISHSRQQQQQPNRTVKWLHLSTSRITECFAITDRIVSLKNIYPLSSFSSNESCT